MNLLGPELVRDLVSLIQRAEADDAVKVLVFRSADPDYFIPHVDVTRIQKYREEAAKLTCEASIALLFRHLSASRLVTIAQIEGRVRGAGSEFVLACDMRFAVRESAIFAQPEPALGVIPGGGGVQHLARLKRPSYLGCRLSVAHASSPPPSDHDRLEIAITTIWNR
jgi:enoyl-CoA hydratase/carnithine racemase